MNKSKNSSPNRLLHPDGGGGGGVDSRSGGHSPTPSYQSQASRTPTTTHAITPISSTRTVNDRRGTHCSISIMDDIENQMNNPNRAGSLPFDQLNNQNQQLRVLDYDDGDGPEVYRVRQFHTTNKGSVINRGDSFKRSFKKSSQSISSANKERNKKENSTATSPNSNNNNNNLNLPDLHQHHASSNVDIHETSFINESSNVTQPMIINDHQQLKQQQLILMQSLSYVVYVMGASTVGKNALIKQFKTSEYRGTYDISAHLSQGN
jgi:hypothetical protein